MNLENDIVKTRKVFEGTETLMFCDETKFYQAQGDLDDLIYYFGIAVSKKDIRQIDKEVRMLLIKYKVQAPVFHASKIFKEGNPRIDLMEALTQIMINYSCRVFCSKYPKALLFDITKVLRKFNNDILNFDKVEFQALFYFLINLNTYLVNTKPHLLKQDIIMYFDRNVYGVNDTEAFNFPHDNFVVKVMTFTEKSRISLLCLPDFFGYIFRKAKITLNDAKRDEKILETSRLTINSFKCVQSITQARLFHYLENDPLIIEKSIQAFLD